LFTKEGGVVLDPFMGSGTTAIACIDTKRNYIGVELNSEYVSITEKRISEALV
jgi:DNA modification methylase